VADKPELSSDSLLEDLVKDLARRVADLEAAVRNPAAPSEDREMPTIQASASASASDLVVSLQRLVGSTARGLSFTGIGVDPGNDYLLGTAYADALGSCVSQVTSLGVIVRDESIDGLAALASALAHPIRVQILKELADGEKSARDLGEAVDMEGGPLYHHLRDLLSAKLVEQPERSRYVLTRAGTILLLSLGAVHRHMRYDGRQPVAPAEWGGEGQNEAKPRNQARD